MEHDLTLFDFDSIYKCKKCGKIFVSKNMIICEGEEFLCNSKEKLNEKTN